jgi:circadian clock protein KaiC
MGVTAIVTGERGEKFLTRQGLEEYVSDCVILLDHRVSEESSTRRLRIIKYRGSMHGTNEYPFLIDKNGFAVFPITSIGKPYSVSNERISSGIPELDDMLGGRGFFKGSSILISGTAGTGKSSIAANFAKAACERGEKTLYFSLEESEAQTIRNMRSIGMDLGNCTKNGLLRFFPLRLVHSGLEMHLTTMHREIDNFGPSVVIIDPINSFVSVENQLEARSLAIRLIDYLKMNQITALMTSLTKEKDDMENTNIFVSSFIDSWILLRDIENNAERNRGIYILKSRGMSHSNQIREFLLTDKGIRLLDVYVGQEGLLTGSARLAMEARERESAKKRQQDIEQIKLILRGKRKEMEAKIAAIKAAYEAEEAESHKIIEHEEESIESIEMNRKEMAVSRKNAIGKKS